MKYTIIIAMLLSHLGLYSNTVPSAVESNRNNMEHVESTASDQFIVTFENSSNHLEGEEIDKLLIVAYRALGSADQVVELSVANDRSTLQKLHEVLQTLQYNGVSTDQILIKTTSPTDSNVDHVSLRIFAQPKSYA